MRVIAGSLGGRRLQAPAGRGTRPTSDRVREAVFSALGDVGATTVLDLYAGTGALGIEALSRGARRAVFVENARPALAALRANVEQLGLREVALVFAVRADRCAPAIARHGPFDLVLVDPPYSAHGDVPRVLTALREVGAIDPSARIVVEHAARDPAQRTEGFEHVATRRYGDSAVSTYALE